MRRARSILAPALPLALGVTAIITLAGCLEPTQYRGPIVVDQRGFQRRFEVLCHVGAGDEVTSAACPRPPRGGPGPARQASPASPSTGTAVAAER